MVCMGILSELFCVILVKRLKIVCVLPSCSLSLLWVEEEAVMRWELKYAEKIKKLYCIVDKFSTFDLADVIQLVPKFEIFLKLIDFLETC